MEHEMKLLVRSGAGKPNGAGRRECRGDLADERTDQRLR
jgi:hypothetical protein